MTVLLRLRSGLLGLWLLWIEWKRDHYAARAWDLRDRQRRIRARIAERDRRRHIQHLRAGRS